MFDATRLDEADILTVLEIAQDKRLLKLLRNAHRGGSDITALVKSMSLSKKELLYVFDDDNDGFASIMSRLLWSFHRIQAQDRILPLVIADDLQVRCVHASAVSRPRQ
ncbi:MAG: hypothetical protein K2Z25_06800 [Beijerinckiaceae bacterium]|nr:hypothetical protein [Beijerinckiaceae bacterium]